MFKIISIGNILMKDDGISDYVLKDIREDILKISDDIQIIYGETDFQYCLKEINKNDIVIIIDGCSLGLSPGTVTSAEISDASNHIFSSQHQLSLPDLLFLYNEKNTVYLIGIEVNEINYGFELSSVLKSKFKKICKDVLKEINQIIIKEVEKDA